MIRRLLTAYTIAMLFALSPPICAQEASAQEEDEAREQSRDSAREKLTVQAEARFKEGKYDEALDLLGRAYAIGKNPKTLYNIALVYEEKGELEKALEYYDQFIVAPDVSPKNRRLALERVTTLREDLRGSSEPGEEETEPEQEDDVTEEQSDKARASAREVGPPPARTHDPPPQQVIVEHGGNREAWRRIGIGFAALGVATATTGGVLGALSLQALTEFEESSDLEAARSEAERANNLAVMADAFYISGAVLGLTGVVIALASWTPGDREAPAGTQAVRLRIGFDRVAAEWKF